MIIDFLVSANLMVKDHLLSAGFNGNRPSVVKC
jgi:hypothetical protein